MQVCLSDESFMYFVGCSLLIHKMNIKFQKINRSEGRAFIKNVIKDLTHRNSVTSDRWITRSQLQTIGCEKGILDIDTTKTSKKEDLVHTAWHSCKSGNNINKFIKTVAIKMKYNKPPTTMKSMCTVKSSLVGIRKTLLLLSHKDNKQLINSNSKCKANLGYSREGLSTSELTKQIVNSKEVLNVKGSYTDENKTLFQGSREDYVPNKYFPLSLAAIDSSIKQDSIDRIYSPDVRTEFMYKFKPNMLSKKVFQGKIDLVQREVNKYVPMTEQPSTEEHKLCNAVNLNLLQVPTNGDIRHDNMPITRSQTVNSRKLYNLNASSYIQTVFESDVNAECSTFTVSKNLVHSSRTGSALEMLRKPKKHFDSVDFQQSIFHAPPSLPEPAVIGLVVKAVIEPLPEDKNKNSKLTQKPKKNVKSVGNKKAPKKVTPIDFDAIEIINSDANRACVRPKTKEINLPRTLKELNRNSHFNEILTKTQECSAVGKHVSQISIKAVNESGRQNCEMSDGEKNYHCNNNVEIPPSKKIVKSKGRIRRRSTQPKSKLKTNLKNIRRKNYETNSGDSSDASFTDAQKRNGTPYNINKYITRRKNTCDFEILTNSIKDNVLTNPSKGPLNTTLIKNRRLLNEKNRLCKRNANQSKNYYPDIVMRQNPYDGCESLSSDDELFTAIKKSKHKINTPITKSKLKYVRRPISMKPIFKLQKKTQSSSSSSLPDLEIELKTPPRRVVMERLTSSDSLLEDIYPEPVVLSPTLKVLSNNSPTLPLEYENTCEEYVRAIVGDKFAIKMAENVPNRVFNQATHCDHDSEGFHKSQDFVAMHTESDSTIIEPAEVAMKDQNALKTDGDACKGMLSPLTTGARVEHSNEAIMSWIETGRPIDATEAFKSISEVLSGYADVVKVSLNTLQGPLHPSYIDLYKMLLKHNHDLNIYLKKN